MSLIRLIITIIIIYLGFKIISALTQAVEKKSYDRKIPKTAREDLVEDMYCHTYVPASDAYVTEYKGRKMYFCSKKCSDDFMTRDRNLRKEEVL